jgi:hypothetical protein
MYIYVGYCLIIDVGFHHHLWNIKPRHDVANIITKFVSSENSLGLILPNPWSRLHSCFMVPLSFYAGQTSVRVGECW